MRNEALGDVLKVWLYAVASVWLGAWLAPLLFNAGKALAEVSQGRTTNGFFEWLAGHCRTADFPAFFLAGWGLAAVVLILPWMEWLHARRGVRTGGSGLGLRKNPRGGWHALAGFLLAAGLLLPLGIALVPAGYLKLRDPGPEWPGMAMRAMWMAWLIALVMEVFFRGVALGVFLRGMRPAAALGMSAAFFALVLSVIPPHDLSVPDPEQPRVGFELLRLMAVRFADAAVVLTEFVPLLALGLVLGYARWRTASLWLPLGLHAGWWFARELLRRLGSSPEAMQPPLAAGLLLHGLVPLAALVAAGALAHFLTRKPSDAHGAES
ncbi:MAG: CPBP family intramembrane glutamic endopeptidase [Luteolibacter sp.]